MIYSHTKNKLISLDKRFDVQLKFHAIKPLICDLLPKQSQWNKKTSIPIENIHYKACNDTA